MSDATPADFTRDLVRWSETLAGIARTGMGFTESLYERERYEEILHVAADIKAAADEALEVRREQDHFVQEWMESVGEGVPGYVTPKVAIGAIVGDDEGRILLVKRPDSGVWLYPTGWADVGYSPSEVAVGSSRGDRYRMRTRAIARGGRWSTHGIQSFRDVHVALPLPSSRRRLGRSSIGDRRCWLVRSARVTRAGGGCPMVGTHGGRGDRGTLRFCHIRCTAQSGVARR